MPARSSWSMLTAACAHGMQQRSPQPQVAIQQRSPQPQVAMRAQCSCRVLTAARACSQLLEHADSCLCPQFSTTVSPAAVSIQQRSPQPQVAMRACSSGRILTAARACSQLLEHADSCLCPQYATTVSPAAGGYSTTVSPAAGGNARSVLWGDRCCILWAQAAVSMLQELTAAARAAHCCADRC